MTMQLMRRAVVLHPRTEYTPESAVRHSRRAYVEAIKYLRDRDLWILDKKVERCAASAT